jgi:hypothetical protein
MCYHREIRHFALERRRALRPLLLRPGRGSSTGFTFCRPAVSY